MPFRLIIHAPNIHTGGGRTLLDAVLASLPTDLNATVVADARLAVSTQASANLEVRSVPATIRGRIGAERWLARNVSDADVVLAFGNLPPLFRLRARVIIFLQNRYLVDDIDLSGFPFAARTRLRLERLWFASRASNADEIIVQTRSMQQLVTARLGDRCRITVLPFVGKTTLITDGDVRNEAQARKTYDFVYVASGEPHKNHRRLIEAWCLLAEENQFPSLLLTLDRSKSAELCSWIDEKSRRFGLNIDCADRIEQGQFAALYRDAGALIYPSTLESFGLPLVEARSLGLPVLASELDYVRDVLDPEQSFDPQSSISIARAVKRQLGYGSAREEIRDADAIIEYICDRQ